jgi:hypothetical protein
MCNTTHPDTVRLMWALDHPDKFRDLAVNDLWPHYTADALANKELINDTLDKARHMDDPMYEPMYGPSQDLLDKLGDDMRH